MRKATHTFARKRSSGMTLVEIMVALGIAALLLGIAAPSFSDFMKNSRLTGAANDLLRSMQTARNEAIKRQAPGSQSVVVCASANPTAATPSCSYGAFSGWIVFQDQNGDWQYGAGEPLIEQHAAVDTLLTVKNDNSGLVSYNVNGFSNPPNGGLTGTRNVVICDSRGVTAVAGSTQSNARAIVLRATGRARVTNLQTETTTAAGLTGGCP